MKKNIILMTILIIVSGMYAEKLATLEEINKPFIFCLDKDQIYITEGSVIYIYSSKNYKLLNKFGRKGEGPKEFKTIPNGNVRTYIHEDFIQVNSIGKISYFKKNGEFIKELITRNSGDFRVLEGKIVGRSSIIADGARYSTISLYDSGLKKIKEVVKYKSPFQNDNSYRVFTNPSVYTVYKDRIFIANKKKFVIDVFDSNGNKLPVIKKKYNRIKVTNKDKIRLLERHKAGPRYDEITYKYIKKNIKFPNFYPAIRHFIIANNKIYVKTHIEKDEKFEHYIFDINGKFIKKTFIHLPMKMTLSSYPYTIYNDKLYQLLENEKKETWELHATLL